MKDLHRKFCGGHLPVRGTVTGSSYGHCHHKLVQSFGSQRRLHTHLSLSNYSHPRTAALKQLQEEEVLILHCVTVINVFIHEETNRGQLGFVVDAQPSLCWPLKSRALKESKPFYSFLIP